MKAKLLMVVVPATIAVGLVAWARWGSDKQSNAAEALPLSVTVQEVQRVPFARLLTVSGTLVGEEEATVISETQGKIIAVKAQVGGWLNQGQTIVQVENDLKLVALAQARAQLLAAETSYDKSQKDLERYNELFQQQITTQSVLENARLAVQAAEAQRKGAEAAVQLAQRHYQDTFIKAPLAGRLADRYVNEAAMVMPGDRIAVIVNNRNMKLKASVAENEVALLHNGETAAILADALPGSNFAGKVISVAQKANAERTYPIEILVQNDAAESMKSGMFGRASIQVAQMQDAVVAPSSAILNEASGNYVYIAENGTAKRVAVHLGMQQERQVEITDGLASGDLLIVSGQQRLRDGAAIKVQQDTAAPAR